MTGSRAGLLCSLVILENGPDVGICDRVIGAARRVEQLFCELHVATVLGKGNIERANEADAPEFAQVLGHLSVGRLVAALGNLEPSDILPEDRVIARGSGEYHAKTRAA